MKQTIFILIATSFFAMSATKAVAQQSRVDSVIMYLKKSFATDKLDSASYSQVLAIIESTSLTDSQIAQIESTLNTFINWQDKETLGLARFSILSSLINNDVGKAISYGKQQIEQLDKINTPEASSIKSQYLSELRFPFRNSNRLEDGFQYYTKKLNEYKIKNDSISIAKCHYVLGGFYRISGLLDLAIYKIIFNTSFSESSDCKSSDCKNSSKLWPAPGVPSVAIMCCKRQRPIETALDILGLSFCCVP